MAVTAKWYGNGLKALEGKLVEDKRPEPVVLKVQDVTIKTSTKEKANG